MIVGRTVGAALGCSPRSSQATVSGESRSSRLGPAVGPAAVGDEPVRALDEVLHRSEHAALSGAHVLQEQQPALGLQYAGDLAQRRRDDRQSSTARRSRRPCRSWHRRTAATGTRRRQADGAAAGPLGHRGERRAEVIEHVRARVGQHQLGDRLRVPGQVGAAAGADLQRRALRDGQQPLARAGLPGPVRAPRQRTGSRRRTAARSDRPRIPWQTSFFGNVYA